MVRIAEQQLENSVKRPAREGHVDVIAAVTMSFNDLAGSSSLDSVETQHGFGSGIRQPLPHPEHPFWGQ